MPAALCLPKMPKLNGNICCKRVGKIKLLLTQSGVGYILIAEGTFKRSKRSYEKDNKTCRGLLLYYMTYSLIRSKLP